MLKRMVPEGLVRIVPRWLKQGLRRALSDDAARYLADANGRVSWLFSAEETDGGGAVRPSPVKVRFEVPLPPEDGRYGRLVCQRRDHSSSVGIAAGDIHRYLAEPVAEALARLEGGPEARPGAEPSSGGERER